MNDMVLVPRKLLSAAAHALETGSESPKTLAAIREHSLHSAASVDAVQPTHEAVVLNAIAAAAGLDLSGPLPEGPLSEVLINAIRNPAPLETDMPPHQLRVLEELAQVSDRLEKLTAFFDTDLYRSLDVDERGRLKEQSLIMGEYQRILAARVSAF